MKVIATKRDLLKALEGLGDNDQIVIDLDTDVEYKGDLYSVSMDVISGIKMEDGTEINEIRLTPVPIEPKTKVVFFIEKGNGTENETPFAFFPEEHFTWDKTDGRFTAYAHVGQHTACHIDYAKSCRLAKPEEYADLKKELESIGYNLEIVKEF